MAAAFEIVARGIGAVISYFGQFLNVDSGIGPTLISVFFVYTTFRLILLPLVGGSLPFGGGSQETENFDSAGWLRSREQGSSVPQLKGRDE